MDPVRPLREGRLDDYEFDPLLLVRKQELESCGGAPLVSVTTLPPQVDMIVEEEFPQKYLYPNDRVPERALLALGRWRVKHLHGEDVCGYSDLVRAAYTHGIITDADFDEEGHVSATVRDGIWRQLAQMSQPMVNASARDVLVRHLAAEISR